MAAAKKTPKAPDALATYRQKRDFTITPEPSAPGGVKAGERPFVIQKHWATRLHYDLRLEIGGTMKSWAVPKGPSLDPADKRMAVQVEDHPISYNTFEGVIPPKQYGAGRVIIWDRGVWEPLGDPAQGWRDGHLKFNLYGHKLQGRWALVRMGGKKARDADKPVWLLIKERDGHERPAAEYSVVEAEPDSVAQLPLPSAPGPAAVPAATIARAAKVTRPAKARRVPLPETLAPQLATLVSGPPPDADQWTYELKFDGYRVLTRVEGAKVQLITRNGNDWTHKLPELAKALRALKLRSAWLDGELVVRRPASGLVTAVEPVMRACSGTWMSTIPRSSPGIRSPIRA